jgi:hypothetical protein
VLGRNLEVSADAMRSWSAQASGRTEAAEAAEPAAPDAPVMPSPPPFPTFRNRPSLSHQAPGGGFESGRDSRAR